MPFLVELIPRLPISERRAVVFVRNDQLRELDAATWFEEIDDPEYRPVNTRRLVRERFDYWIGGGPPHKKYFHGWNVPGYRMCFCFKWTERNVMNRFYGFLWHPQPTTRPRFEVCALLSHDFKYTNETEEAHLRLAARLFGDARVRTAIQMHYPDKIERRH